MSRRAKIENLINANETMANKLIKNRFKDNNYYFYDEIDNIMKNQKLGKIR